MKLLEQRLDKFGWGIHNARYNNNVLMELSADKTVNGENILLLFLNKSNAEHYGPYFHIMKKINRRYDTIYMFNTNKCNELHLVEKYVKQDVKSRDNIEW